MSSLEASASSAPAWGPQQTAIACYDDFVPMLLGGTESLLNGFLKRRKRDIALVVLTVILLVSVSLLWPILFSLRVDGTTSMSWAAVWTPLWITDGIGLMFFVFIVSWGPIKAPAEWQGEWRDPYPMSMRVLALVKWGLLVLFQVLLVLRLDRHISWSWEEVLAPLMAWVWLRIAGELYRIVLQTKRLFVGRVIAAIKAMGEAAMLFLQVLFLMWRLDGEVNWNWWVVFVPIWLLHAGQLFTWCTNQALAMYLARGLEDDDGSTEEQRRKLLEASVLMDNAKHSHKLLGGTLVTSVLAVYLVAGADYSAFIVFLPQFISAIWFTFVVTCIVCFAGRQARQEEADWAEGGGLNTDV
ncbi:unnamed protein product [Ectocarpus sp. 6 AP-2014]